MPSNIDVKVTLSAQDNASHVLKRFEGTAREVGNGISDTFKQGGLAAGGFIAALTGLGVAATKIASDFEQNRISFDTMLGSAQKGAKLMKEISDFAVKTPFELPQLVEGSKRLLAYNIEAEKIIPTLKMLGDIASGVGMDKLPNLILAFGQVKAATKLTGMELRQFSEAGVPLLKALVDEANKGGGALVKMGGASKATAGDIKEMNYQLGHAKQKLAEATASGKAKESTLMSLNHTIEKYEGKLASASGTQEGFTKRVKVTEAEIKDMVSEGKISFEQVQKALEGMTGEGGKFFNLMENQSKTFGGVMSNIKDQIVRSLAEIAGISIEKGGEIREGSMFAVLKQGAESFLQILNNVTPQIVAFTTALSQNETALIALAGALGGTLVLAAGAFIIAFGPAILILGAFMAAGAILAITLQDMWDKINQLIPISDLFSSAQDRERAASDSLWESIERVNDAKGRLTDSGLRLERAEISLKRAIENLDKTQRTYKDGSLEVEDAKLRVKEAERGVEQATKDVHTKVKELDEKYKKDYLPTVDKVKEATKEATGKLKENRDMWDGIRGAIDGALSKFREFLSFSQKYGVGLNVPIPGSLLGKQAGGIVPGPIDQPRAVLAHGGEEVVPVGAKGQEAGQGAILNVYVGTFIGSEIEKRNLARELYGGLVQLALAENKSVSELMGA